MEAAVATVRVVRRLRLRLELPLLLLLARLARADAATILRAYGDEGAEPTLPSGAHRNVHAMFGFFWFTVAVVVLGCGASLIDFTTAPEPPTGAITAVLGGASLALGLPRVFLSYFPRWEDSGRRQVDALAALVSAPRNRSRCTTAALTGNA